jgi:hypothetical protein
MISIQNAIIRDLCTAKKKIFLSFWKFHISKGMLGNASRVSTGRNEQRLCLPNVSMLLSFVSDGP